MSFRQLRQNRRVLGALGVLIVASVAIPTFAAAEIFVAIDSVAGEATKVGFVGQIEVDSISLGYSVPSMTSGSDARVKPVFAPVTITKLVDKSTPVLMTAGATGQVFSKIVISSVAMVADKVVTVQTLTLNNATVTSWRLVETESNGGRAIEQVTFASTALSITYQPGPDKSGKLGAPVTGSIK